MPHHKKLAWIVAAVAALCGHAVAQSPLFLLGFEPPQYKHYAGGMRIQNWEGTNGLMDFGPDNSRAKEAKWSLRLSFDCSGRDPDRIGGEWYVDLQDTPAGLLDLCNTVLTAWVFVPKEAVGDHKRPNGLQLFVKDAEDWRGLYSSWHNAQSGWMKLTLPVSANPRAPAGGGWMAPGFDPSAIRCIGVKYAIGTGSSRAFKGSLYLDGVKVVAEEDGK